MYRKIMVPLDGSILSEQALPYVIRLANQLEAKVLLIKVVDTSSKFWPASPFQQSLALVEGQEYLTQVRHFITDPGLLPYLDPNRVKTMCISGSIVEQLSEAANSEKIDLLMMTTHGRSGLSRLVAGSIASQLLYQVMQPVMLIRPLELNYGQFLNETLHGLAEPGIECFDGSKGNLLLTLDGSAESATVLEPAIVLARQMKATLHLLIVIVPAVYDVYGELDGIGYDRAKLELNNARKVELAQIYQDKIQQRVMASGLECVKMVKVGDVPGEILAYSRQIDAQSIVMASHKRTELARFFPGSVAHEVLRKSHLPVLIVPAAIYIKKDIESKQPETVGAG